MPRGRAKRAWESRKSVARRIRERQSPPRRRLDRHSVAMARRVERIFIVFPACMVRLTLVVFSVPAVRPENRGPGRIAKLHGTARDGVGRKMEALWRRPGRRGIL